MRRDKFPVPGNSEAPSAGGVCCRAPWMASWRQGLRGLPGISAFLHAASRLPNMPVPFPSKSLMATQSVKWGLIPLQSEARYCPSCFRVGSGPPALGGACYLHGGLRRLDQTQAVWGVSAFPFSIRIVLEHGAGWEQSGLAPVLSDGQIPAYHQQWPGNPGLRPGAPCGHSPGLCKPTFSANT